MKDARSAWKNGCYVSQVVEGIHDDIPPRRARSWVRAVVAGSKECRKLSKKSFRGCKAFSCCKFVSLVVARSRDVNSVAARPLR